MSIRRNAVASYVSQAYVMLIGIVIMPLYVRYMGVESFGLIGFYATLQALFQLLDMGLAPTMTRESARFQGGATDALSLRRLLRVLECIFASIALIGSSGLILFSEYLAANWLKISQLPIDEVLRSIQLISIIVALRWSSVLYRGVISGFEKFTWLSGFNIGVATCRFVLVLPLLIFVDSSPSFYFSYQLAIVLAELFILVWKSYGLFPHANPAEVRSWNWVELRKVLGFSLTIGLTSIIGILSTQVDRILLSHLLPLAEYGYFTLAVLAASGVMVAASPVGGVLLPRLTRLSAEGQLSELTSLYRKATQLIGVIAIPVAMVMVFFSEQVLWVWTGDIDTARKVAPAMELFAIGNGLYVFAAFPYYLQFARGNLRLHVISSISFLVLYIPLLLYLTSMYGMNGAGYAWIIANLIPLTIWAPVVHRRFISGVHFQWISHDIAPVVLLSLSAAIVISQFIKWMEWPIGRFYVAVEVVLIGLILLGVAMAGSSWSRAYIMKQLARSEN